jgi:thioredoxin
VRLKEYNGATLCALLGEADSVLVHFGTDWCAPCKRLERTLLGLLQTGSLGAQVAKVNVEDEPDLAKHYSVTKNPTLCYFFKGELVKTRVGMACEKTVLGMVGGNTDD